METRTYRDLVAWQRAMDFAAGVYALTLAFPRDEQYGLSSQLRRAAVSVPSNIAEGQGRGEGREFAHHLRIAQGSIQEAETQLFLCKRLNYGPPSQIDNTLSIASEVARLIRRLEQAVSLRHRRS